MTEPYKYAASAEGWWRIGDAPAEPITDVQLYFYEGRFSGSGIDSRGVFALHGKGLEENSLTIRKHYGVIPGADLIGQYDGEGMMWGTWTSGPHSGTWALRISGPLKPHDDEAFEAAVRRMLGGWNFLSKCVEEASRGDDSSASSGDA